MSIIHDKYIHLKCDDPNCTGVVVLIQRPINSSGYRCHECGKEISYHYVSTHADIHSINDKTGWIFPMIRRKEKRDDI